jgi:hypothetical protein
LTMMRCWSKLLTSSRFDHSRQQRVHRASGLEQAPKLVVATRFGATEVAWPISVTWGVGDYQSTLVLQVHDLRNCCSYQIPSPPTLGLPTIRIIITGIPVFSRFRTRTRTRRVLAFSSTSTSTISLSTSTREAKKLWVNLTPQPLSPKRGEGSQNHADERIVVCPRYSPSRRP